MGYVKNLTAQTLSAKTPMQLAVVVTGVSEQTENSSFFFGIMQGVNSFANQNGYETVVYMMEKSPECFETYCRQRGAGGMRLPTQREAPESPGGLQRLFSHAKRYPLQARAQN